MHVKRAYVYHTSCLRLVTCSYMYVLADKELTQTVLHAMVCLLLLSSKHCIIEPLFFFYVRFSERSGIMKPSVRQMTLAKTLIIQDIRKTSSNNCL